MRPDLESRRRREVTPGPPASCSGVAAWTDLASLPAPAPACLHSDVHLWDRENTRMVMMVIRLSPSQTTYVHNKSLQSRKASAAEHEESNTLTKPLPSSWLSGPGPRPDSHLWWDLQFLCDLSPTSTKCCWYQIMMSSLLANTLLQVQTIFPRIHAFASDQTRSPGRRHIPSHWAPVGCMNEISRRQNVSNLFCDLVAVKVTSWEGEARFGNWHRWHVSLYIISLKHYNKAFWETGNKTYRRTVQLCLLIISTALTRIKDQEQ